MTTAEKNAAIKELNKQMINPENPSGSVAGTAASKRQTTAESKATPKQNTEIKTKEGQKALEKDLQQKARAAAKSSHVQLIPSTARAGRCALPLFFRAWIS